MTSQSKTTEKKKKKKKKKKKHACIDISIKHKLMYT